jgi:hypothetical protein
MAAGRGGLVATARNDLVNFGFQEPWKRPTKTTTDHTDHTEENGSVWSV